MAERSSTTGLLGSSELSPPGCHLLRGAAGPALRQLPAAEQVGLPDSARPTTWPPARSSAVATSRPGRRPGSPTRQLLTPTVGPALRIPRCYAPPTTNAPTTATTARDGSACPAVSI